MRQHVGSERGDARAAAVRAAGEVITSGSFQQRFITSTSCQARR
jgi:hypothetical protein